MKLLLTKLPNFWLFTNLSSKKTTSLKYTLKKTSPHRFWSTTPLVLVSKRSISNYCVESLRRQSFQFFTSQNSYRARSVKSVEKCFSKLMENYDIFIFLSKNMTKSHKTSSLMSYNSSMNLRMKKKYPIVYSSRKYPNVPLCNKFLIKPNIFSTFTMPGSPVH